MDKEHPVGIPFQLSGQEEFALVVHPVVFLEPLVVVAPPEADIVVVGGEHQAAIEEFQGGGGCLGALERPVEPTVPVVKREVHILDVIAVHRYSRRLDGGAQDAVLVDGHPYPGVVGYVHPGKDERQHVTCVGDVEGQVVAVSLPSRQRVPEQDGNLLPDREVLDVRQEARDRPGPDEGASCEAGFEVDPVDLVVGVRFYGRLHYYNWDKTFFYRWQQS